MISAEAIEQIQEQINQKGLRFLLHTADGSEWLSDVHKQIFGEAICTTCPGTLSQAIEKILHLTKQKIHFMADRKYKMGDGIIDTVYQPIEGVPVHVTNANLTNEVAELLLITNPNYAAQIFRIDGEPIAPDTGSRLAELMTHTKAELKDMLKEGVEYNPEDLKTKDSIARLVIAQEAEGAGE